MSRMEPWSTRERVVLAHAVERFGTADWPSVSRAAKRLLGPSDTYSVKGCSREYTRMQEEGGGDVPTPRELARAETAVRVAQLRGRIARAEQRLASLVAALAAPAEAWDVTGLVAKRARTVETRPAVPWDDDPLPPGTLESFRTPVPPRAAPAAPGATDARLLWSVFESIAGHRMADVFQEPVTDQVAPGYSMAVLQPMSLSVIRARLHDGTICTGAQLHHALTLMLTNAALFNPPQSEVHRVTQVMFEYVRKECEPLLVIEEL